MGKDFLDKAVDEIKDESEDILEFFLDKRVLWWLLPVFFGILGGAISYVAFYLIYKEKRKANWALLFGIAVTVIVFALGLLGILGTVILPFVLI